MGSGGWFRAILNSKKVKDDSSKQVKGSSAAKSNGFKWKNHPRKASAGHISENAKALNMTVEDLAATRIQTAFRVYLARKTLRRLKRIGKLHILSQNFSTKKQAATTLVYLHSWSKVQAQIRARRICMVTEGRLRQKKLENQLKLEAKLHDLEVEWCGGSDTMDEILGRIHQREEAAVRRERAMAYAFSHQWRADSGLNLGPVNYELGKANWGWSWKERWIAARPWESRLPAQSISPNKSKNRPAKVSQDKKSPSIKATKAEKTNSPSAKANKIGENTNSPSTKANKVSESTELTVTKVPDSSKSPLPNGKGSSKARRLSYPPIGDRRASPETSIKSEQVIATKDQLVS